jgi:regulatory protein
MPSYQSALERAMKYCASQERCIRQVQTWLRKLVSNQNDIQKITETLKDEGFINEERYARAYARGKFTINGWGRVKIIINLKGQGLSEQDINLGITEIDEEFYLKKLESLLEKKYNSLLSVEDDQFIIQGKTVAYCWTKGYEPELISETMKKIINK